LPALASDLRRSAEVRAIQLNEPATVNIHGQKTINSPDEYTGRNDGPRRVNGMGSGVIIDERGYIMTNFHVVDGVRNIQVTLSNRKTYTAVLLAQDARTDLALIKISCPDKLPTICVGTSSDLMKGEPVIAIGNAYGYEDTVTRGIVSALHRTVQVSDTQDYEDLIQTDAPINPGNSGGPLINIDGEMIGINVAVRAGAQNIGFAIPVDKVMNVASNLMNANKIDRVYSGLVTQASPKRKGAVVKNVDDASPAAQGGLRPGDIITAIGNRDVERPLDVDRAMLGRKTGEEVTVTVERNSQPVQVTLVLDGPGARRQVAANTEPDAVWDTFGLKLTVASAAQVKQINSRYRGGLSVLAVRPDSAAAKQGIKKGDIVVGMHVWETISLDNVQYVLTRTDLADAEPIKVHILRGTETLYGFLPLTRR